MNQCDTARNRQQQSRRRTQAAKSVGPLVFLLMFHGLGMAFSTLFDLFVFDKTISWLTNHKRADLFWKLFSNEQTKCTVLRNETLYPILFTRCILDFVMEEVYQVTQVSQIFRFVWKHFRARVRTYFVQHL